MKHNTNAYTKNLSLIVIVLLLITGIPNSFLSFNHLLFATQLHKIHQSALLNEEPWQYYPYINNQEYPTIPSLDARAYLLVDLHSSYILASYKAEQLHIMASLTKMMTAYIVLQYIAANKLQLHDRYKLTDDIIFKNLPSDASRMGLVVGDNPSIEELLLGLVVASGNDAAIMLANILFGNESIFVEQMNIQACKLGLFNTLFVDSSGLSPKNISNAGDIAKLALQLLKFEKPNITTFTKKSSMKWHKNKHNTNILLDEYEGIDGLKTGYIEESGFNFVATAERSSANNQVRRRLLAVVLGATGTNITEGVRNRAEIAKILLDYGFLQFNSVLLDYNVQEILIWGAKTKTTTLVAAGTIVLLPVSWNKNIYSTLYIPKYVWAPLVKDEVIGSVEIFYQSANDINNIYDVSTIELSSFTRIEKANIFVYLVDYARVLFDRIFN